MKIPNKLRDDEIKALFIATHKFVEAGKRVIERASRKGYIPNPDQSHYWAWLQASLDEAECTLNDCRGEQD